MRQEEQKFGKVGRKIADKDKIKENKQLDVATMDQANISTFKEKVKEDNRKTIERKIYKCMFLFLFLFLN